MTQEELLNPTPEQIIERNELLAQALEANEVKAWGTMYNEATGGRCCLCVAEDLARTFGVKIYVPRCGYIDEKGAKFFGWKSNDPYFILDVVNGFSRLASELNDGIDDDNGYTHKEIAQFVRNTFCCCSSK